MSILFNIVYVSLLMVALPWYVWQALRTGKYRADLQTRLTGRVPVRQGNQPCVWLHAVSVGEVNLLAPLIAGLEEALPNMDCVISSTTDAGVALARDKYGPRCVFRCPLDFSWAVRAALQRIRPNVLVLAELELWPNLILATKRRGSKIAIINGRLSDRSYRGYNRIRWIVRQLLRNTDVIGAQNEQYADRFTDLGAASSSVHVTGSLKFDGANTNRDNPVTKHLATLAQFSTDDVVLLAGSTQDPEEEMALAVYQKVAAEYPQLRLIIVPRHPERFEAVATMLCRSEMLWQRRSELGQEKKTKTEARILLIDAVGELGAWWGTAQIAYVGGSMGSRGGQNMIEPAAYGAVVSFGPHTQNFRDVVAALLAAEAAVVVHDRDELEQFIRRAIKDKHFANHYGRSAKTLVMQHKGATARTVKLLMPLLQPSSETDAGVNRRQDPVQKMADMNQRASFQWQRSAGGGATPRRTSRS